MNECSLNMKVNVPREQPIGTWTTLPKSWWRCDKMSWCLIPLCLYRFLFQIYTDEDDRIERFYAMNMRTIGTFILVELEIVLAPGTCYVCHPENESRMYHALNPMRHRLTLLPGVTVVIVKCRTHRNTCVPHTEDAIPNEYNLMLQLQRVRFLELLYRMSFFVFVDESREPVVG